MNLEALRARVDIAGVIGAAVKLRGRGNATRGKCPFHGSKSESLAVYPESGRAKCWGCGWSGDAIQFVQDFYGLDFKAACERLAAEHGLDGLAPAPAVRTKQTREWRAPETVDSAEVGRWIWDNAAPAPDKVRVWLTARKVPPAGQADRLLRQVRFCEAAPISAWPIGKGPDAVAQAPAMVCLMRRLESCHPPAAEGHDPADVRPLGGASMPGVLAPDGELRWIPAGVHVTYLSPGLKSKMNRKRANGEAVPARKMFGAAAGAAVILGEWRRDCPLYVGEGIETVLSGMALLDAPEDACGLAVLSLDNLQGRAAMRPVRHEKGVGKGLMALPIHDPRPDLARLPVCFAHDGPVTGLIDADMAPLKGMIDRETGQHRGLPVIERPGGPAVWRTISAVERAAICAALFTHAWRGAGCRQVRTLRPRAGQDFNDYAREAAA